MLDPLFGAVCGEIQHRFRINKEATDPGRAIFLHPLVVRKEGAGSLSSTVTMSNDTTPNLLNNIRSSLGLGKGNALFGGMQEATPASEKPFPPGSPVGSNWEVVGNPEEAPSEIDDVKLLLRENQQRMDLQQAHTAVQQEQLVKLGNLVSPLANLACGMQEVAAEARLRALEAQVGQQGGQLQRLRAFQQRIERQNEELRVMTAQMVTERTGLEKALTPGGKTIGQLVEEMVNGQGGAGSFDSSSRYNDTPSISSLPASAPTPLSLERWPGADGEDNSWIISNGLEIVLVDCVESTERAQALADALRTRPEDLVCIFLTRAPCGRHPDHLSGESLRVLRAGLSEGVPVLVATREIKAEISNLTNIATEVVAPGGKISLPAGGVITPLVSKQDSASGFAEHLVALWMGAEKMLVSGDMISNNVHGRCGPPRSIGKGDARWLEDWLEALAGMSSELATLGGGLENVRVAPGSGEMAPAATLFSAMKLYLQIFKEEVQKTSATRDSVFSAMDRRFPDHKGAEKVLAISTSHFVQTSAEDEEENEDVGEEDQAQQEGRVRSLSAWAESGATASLVDVKKGRRVSISRTEGDGEVKFEGTNDHALAGLAQGFSGSSSAEEVDFLKKFLGTLTSGWPCERITSHGRFVKRTLKLVNPDERPQLIWTTKKIFNVQKHARSLELTSIRDVKYGAWTRWAHLSESSDETGQAVSIHASDRDIHEFKMADEAAARTFVKGILTLIKTNEHQLSTLIREAR